MQRVYGTTFHSRIHVENTVTQTKDTAVQIDEPLVLKNPDDIQWEKSCELLVVGLGAAGASTAIHAAENGTDVLIIDRFGHGGATAKSGGVVYGGGGTSVQKKLGIEDTPEEMFKYLRQETGDAVTEDTLRRFCNDSPGLIGWLESIGASFDSDAEPPKTSYPKNGIYLYYSGNEAILPYAGQAKPAPRGHRTRDKGLSGKKLFSILQGRVDALNIPIVRQCAARRLITDSNGQVIGIQAMQLLPGTKAALKHDKLIHRADAIHNGLPGPADRMRARAVKIEEAHAVPVNIRASKGVVLTTGGFIFNRDMVARYAPNYQHNMRLGTTGCDGSGIRLGQSVGGQTDRMHKASAWRFINPPQDWVKGIAVNTQGERFCNEASYGARLGVKMCDENNGKAWLIIDSKIRSTALREALFNGLWIFQSIPALMLMLFAKRSRSIIGLAEKIKVPAERLQAEIHAYNRVAMSGEGVDNQQKTPDRMQPLNTSPYLAMNISAIDNAMFPCPTITLGGLKIDETTGAVLNASGQSIAGLYAAGRAAIGIASNGYVSGLSIADCLWSGRRVAKATSGLTTPDNDTSEESEQTVAQAAS